MTEDRPITHRLGIVELPDQLAVLKRMLAIAHGPQAAQAFLAALEGYRFVVLAHPELPGARPFTSHSLEAVFAFFEERWRLSRAEGSDFHYVVNASAEVEARIDLFAMELTGVIRQRLA